MNKLKLLIGAVGVIALAAILICQQTKIEHLAAEAATLREHIQRQAPAQNEVEQPVRPEPSQEMRPNPVSSLTEGQLPRIAPVAR